MLELSWPLIIWSMAGMTFVYTVGGLITSPKERGRRVLVNMATGLAAGFVWNLLLGGAWMPVHMNIVTVVAAGGLGIPGVALAAALQWLL